LGGWTRVGGVTLGAAVSQYGDQITRRVGTTVDTITIEVLEIESVTRTAALLSARWANRFLELDARGGMTIGDSAPWRWAEGRALVWPGQRGGAAARARAP